MAGYGFEEFVMRAKRYVENFIRTPNKETLYAAENELQKYDGIQMQMFQVRLLMPLMLKLDKLNGENIELQAGIIRLMKTVISRTFLKDVKAIKTMLLILIKQVRECEKSSIKSNLSEEIKLATIECITEIFQRSTSDVLEQYYTKESALFMGQILLTAVEFIAFEKYRKLVISSIHCLMAVFYVHDRADACDIVLRNQVADTVFIFVPKVITQLFKTALSDEKLGETLISTAIKALGRILLIMFDKGDRGSLPRYDQKAFIDLVTKSLESQTIDDKNDLFIKTPKHAKPDLEEQLNRLQSEGRTAAWFDETASKIQKLLPKLTILRANQSRRIRFEYAKLCCQLLEKCSPRLGDNNLELLESIMAMSQDEDETIQKLCSQSISSIQRSECSFIFDDLVDVLFDKHLTKLPRVIDRCEEEEQYSEFQFFKGFFQSVSDRRLKMLFTFTKNLEVFCLCLVSAFELKMQPGLLVEEYALRDICEDEHVLHTNSWRKFKNLDSIRVLNVLCDVCKSLGRPETCNIVYDYLMELLGTSSEIVNEIILISGILLTSESGIKKDEMVKSFLNELLDESHWHLALHPDEMRRLKVKKKSNWYVDRTPGLYESAIEIRVHDCYSDDSDDEDSRLNTVNVGDAQLNVLHTCIVLDALGNLAVAMGERFKPFVFQALHKVLLKAGSSNYNVYLCGSYALSAMRKALGYDEMHELLEEYTDYISYHMRTLLKRPSESQSACDILSVVFRYSSLNTVAYIESIFSVIQEECAKAHQTDNVISYLKLFHVFFSNVPKWTIHVDQIGKTTDEDEDVIEIQIEDADPYTKWMNILNKPKLEAMDMNDLEEISKTCETEPMEQDEAGQRPEEEEQEEANSELPRYIKLTNEIIGQIIKFVSSQNKMQQIVALECLISGLPLLKDYENELLPLVHRIWQPFVERVKDKDPIVLNRCFSLLEVLAIHAKDFLLRRTLKEVLPFLVEFLTSSAAKSKTEPSLAQTQEFKLQTKLLKEFATLIVNMEIGGKPFNNISQAVALYLSKKQPLTLQTLAIDYFKELKTYNGPFVYIVVLKKEHILEYKENVEQVLDSFKAR